MAEPTPHSRGLLRLVIAVGSIALIARLVGAAKDLIVADELGTSDALDAFLMASLLPLFITNTISASFGEALVPVFVRVRDRDGHEAVQRTLAGATAITLATLFAVTIPILIAGRPILGAIARGFSESKLDLTWHLALPLLPMQVIGGLSAVWSHVLNASGLARRTAMLPTIAPALMVVGLAVGGVSRASEALVLGLLLGSIVEATILAISVKRLGYSILPKWTGMTPELRVFAGQCLPLAGASFLATGSSLIDQGMASWLGSGAIAMLNYGTRVTLLGMGIANMALSTVLYPHFATLIAKRAYGELVVIVRRYTLLLFVAGIVACISLIATSHLIIHLLYERGSFTAADTDAVARIQQLYLLQLPFHLSGLVGVRLVSALGKNRILLVFTAVTGALNLVANYVFMQRWGVAGIALSTSLVFVLSFVMVFITVRALLKKDLG